MGTVIVHAEKDEAQTKRIEDALHQAGLPVWRTGDLLVVQSEVEELERRLVDGTDVVICLSPMALGLGLIHLVANAVTSARGRGDRIRLFPVLLSRGSSRPESPISAVVRARAYPVARGVSQVYARRDDGRVEESTRERR
jgi:hypothetical protein